MNCKQGGLLGKAGAGVTEGLLFYEEEAPVFIYVMELRHLYNKLEMTVGPSRQRCDRTVYTAQSM